MSLQIVTNNHYRPLVSSYELTEKERKDFDYLDWEEIDQGIETTVFFRYKGRLYDLAEFVYCSSNDNFKAWDGYNSEGFFSGLLVKLSDCGEAVRVGRYYS